MYTSITSLVLASMVFSSTSALPLIARDICGASPTGSSSQTPLSQPSGITTAADCATQCRANPACQSFLFGSENGQDTCELFSTPASNVPAQNGLMAYDISCSDIPSSSSSSSSSSTASTSSPSSNTGPSGGNAGNHPRQQQGGNTGSGTGSGNTGSGNTGNGNTGSGSTGSSGNQGSTHANPTNGTPSGNPTPIAQPSVTDLSACLAACEGNSACVAYTFSSGLCNLFS